ncbi:uncharacterized protein L969DRAFT_93640 [Mixia osmundae IAM 14324]|uniref:Oxidized purine nucleoside triphosphate hydrolase n=1 Tax=Mixia osmundae (strain CBS 9802 / IAM 14324 / JCM 22182 / KY 12970) TaxID=764103 RepID=G7E959_MIXOS|nr:uncharacterized protein L969DRAFT_93640 [Mixia osmundae IAM 14324]KEI39798.1 hypothetical protein L969DRAFT_93640 [Mixia osmundae IAM 14324]GAA99178.1 hypothetical protein E5Q_05870 [Mixia osmundae IAM 14324]
MSLPEWLPIDESVPHQLLTLVFPVRQGHVLLGMKRRGFGSGLYNGFGGKVHADETVVQGAARELLEEACITSADLIYAGKLFFAFETQPRLMEVFVFLCEQWTGEPHITDEMQPEWFALDGVPFDRMWPDDVLWLDALLRTKAPVLGRVDFALPEEGARTEDGRLRRCSFLDAGDARTSVAALGVTREAHAQSFGTTPKACLVALAASVIGTHASLDKRQRQTPLQQVMQMKTKTLASDGGSIIDQTVIIDGMNIRFRVAAPASAFVTPPQSQAGTQSTAMTGQTFTSSRKTNATASRAASNLGLNVLLHGDGGQSFIAFPNQDSRAGLIGVAVLAPDAQLHWGGGSGVNRPNSAAQTRALQTLVTQVLPPLVSFDSSKVYFSGVSGGSILLSSFVLPMLAGPLQIRGALMSCGGLAPKTDFVDAAKVLPNLRVHWQSTTAELDSLKQSIPPALTAYEQLAASAGMTKEQINRLQTADATPTGGHCAFDGRDFESGVAALMSDYSSVIQGDGSVRGLQGINNVAKGVIGQERLFA